MTVPSRLRGYLRAPATSEEVEGFRLGSRPLPEAVRDFYRQSNGFEVPELDTEILSIAAARRYGEAISRLAIADYYGLLPITNSNDSNPYCVVLGDRLNGAVMLLDHEGEVRVSHSSLQRFLESLADCLDDEAESVEDLEPEETTDPRIVAEADAVVLELLKVPTPDFPLLFPVISACSPQVLIALLQVNDMWVRERAAIRCGQLEIVEARESLQRLASAGNGQDSRAAKASLKPINRKLFSKD